MAAAGRTANSAIRMATAYLMSLRTPSKAGFARNPSSKLEIRNKRKKDETINPEARRPSVCSRFPLCPPFSSFASDFVLRISNLEMHAFA
jgi:hypothetical protein